MNHAAFKQFLARHDCGVRAFAAFCRANLSKTTIHRLTLEDSTLSPNFLEQIRPHLINEVRRFCEERGVEPAEITETLSSIFQEEFEPMITERSKLDYDVLDFFGLDRDPFALEADPRSPEEAYTHKDLDRIVRRVEDAIKYQGFIAVIGPVGAGKTSLKNRVADKLNKQGKTRLLWPRFADMKRLNAGGIVHFILEEFGQKGRARLPLAQRQLEHLLEQMSDAGERVALCFDECHRLDDRTLSALKNFYELGTGGYVKFLGLILFGQPSFKHRLRDEQFREITERVEIQDMPSIAKAAADYLGHRLALAGGSVEKLFEPAAISIIASQASTPLALGNLANRALIEAYKKGEKRVLARFLDKDHEPQTRPLSKRRAA